MLNKKLRLKGPVDNNFEHTYVFFVPHFRAQPPSGNHGDTHFFLRVRRNGASDFNVGTLSGKPRLSISENTNKGRVIRYFFGKNDASNANLTNADLGPLAAWMISKLNTGANSFTVENA